MSVCVVLYNLEIVCVFLSKSLSCLGCLGVCVLVKSPEAGHGACLIKSGV